MDKISCIAYLLYQFNAEKSIKDIAVLLLNGDINLKQLKRNQKTLPYIKEVEQYLKEHKVDIGKVATFIEEFMYVEV